MKTNNEVQEQSMMYHPYNIMTNLMLVGMVMLFLATAISYIYSRVQNGMPPIQVPLVFLVNTLMLIAGSVTMKQAQKAYRNDETEDYKMSLLVTLLLTLFFMVAQCFAWQTMIWENIHTYSSNAAGYIYVISILHILHVSFGIPFMISFLIVAYKRMKEPVSVLVYFSDPIKALKLRLLTRYWKFLEYLWIFLLLFFYINYFISDTTLASIVKFFTV